MASILAPVVAQAESGFTTVKIRCLTRHGGGNLQLAMLAEGSADDFRRLGHQPSRNQPGEDLPNHLVE